MKLVPLGLFALSSLALLGPSLAVAAPKKAAAKSDTKASAPAGASEKAAKEKPAQEADKPSAQAEPAEGEASQAEPAEPVPEPDKAAAEAPTTAASASTTEAPKKETATSGPFQLSLQIPVAEYSRKRLSRDSGITNLKTDVDAVFHSWPSLRLWYDLAPWVALGGELSGGVSTSNIDGSPTTTSLVTVGLEVSGRFAPWTYAWGYPQLTLGVGGRYLDGRFMDASASAPTVTAFIPTGSAELGVVFWLVKDVVGVEAGATGAYTFGPATLNVGEGQGSWVEQMDISLDSGLLARF